MTAPAREVECIGCDEPFDANGWCPRCQHFERDLPPEKTLEQLIAERPDLQAYRDQLRARLWGIEVYSDPIKRRAA